MARHRSQELDQTEVLDEEYARALEAAAGAVVASGLGKLGIDAGKGFEQAAPAGPAKQPREVSVVRRPHRPVLGLGHCTSRFSRSLTCPKISSSSRVWSWRSLMSGRPLTKTVRTSPARAA